MAYPRFIWEDRIENLAAAAITASTSATGYPASNVKDRREYTQWESGVAGGAEWLMFDFGAPVQVKALGIAGHNLNSAGATNITLNADNAGAGHPLANNIVAAFSPPNDRALANFFTNTYRYWELYFPAVVSKPLQIGVVFLAVDYLQFENLVTFPFDPDRQVGHYAEKIGDSGHLLGVLEMFKERVFTINIPFQSQAWTANSFWPFINTNGRKPFFFAFDYVNRPAEVSYVRITSSDITAPYNQVWRSTTLELSGLFDAQ
jgi:hypothetical protein